MPYFERKPWLETVQKIATPGPSDAAKAKVGDEPGIVDIARNVLAAEMRPQYALEGPYRCRETLAPGQSGSIKLEVSADKDGGTLTLDLSPSELRSRDGMVIPPNNIEVHPGLIAVAPSSSARFLVEIMVPLQAEPGVYTGRVVGSGPEPVSFLIEVEVGQAKA